MMKNLFPNFLQDQKEYEQAETLWHQRWADLVRRLRQEWLWHAPWLNTTFIDGTPCRDGNPIFSAVSPKRRLGIRVIQVEPADNPREIHAWTDTFAKGDPNAIKALVITCALTEQTLLDAIDLMTEWVSKEQVGFVRENDYLDSTPMTQSMSPRPLELAVA